MIEQWRVQYNTVRPQRRKTVLFWSVTVTRTEFYKHLVRDADPAEDLGYHAILTGLRVHSRFVPVEPLWILIPGLGKQPLCHLLHVYFVRRIASNSGARVSQATSSQIEAKNATPDLVPFQVGMMPRELSVNNAPPPPYRAASAIDAGPPQPRRHHHCRQRPGFPLAAGPDQAGGADQARQQERVVNAPDHPRGSDQSRQHQGHLSAPGDS